MSREGLKLHLNRKRALIETVLFAVVLCVLNTITFLAVKDDCAQMTSILHSKYLFSAVSKDSDIPDSYYHLNAGISFSTSKKLEHSIGTEIVMQLKEQLYSDAVYWNASMLEADEIAISENIASNNGLHIGEVLYSKHVVDGIIRRYSIREIIPPVSRTRISREITNSSGIIIMGFDKSYFDNISHESLIFSTVPVEDLSKRINFSNVVYREDEITILWLHIVPYVILDAVLAVLCIFGFTLFQTRGISYNFRRQMILGFSAKKLNSLYYSCIYGLGSLLTIVVFLFVILTVCLTGLNQVQLFIVFLIFLIKIVVLVYSARIMNRRLWRVMRI